MAALIVGTFDPTGWSAGDTSTWPQLPDGIPYYEPTMAWRVVVAGAAFGYTLAAGDLLFAYQDNERLWGMGGYGDMVYGGWAENGWIVDVVGFVKWDSTLPPPDLWPQPYSGCPFTRTDLPDGNWAPGWRIVIDCYGPPRVGSRTYGQLNYGDEVYGDDAGVGGNVWQDITRPMFRVTTGDGNSDGSATVVVSELLVELADEDGDWFDIAPPATWFLPQSGHAIRVGFLDPAFRYHGLFSGVIERIEDPHDGDHPRTVSVRAFGRVIDLAVDVAQVQLPAALASERYKTLTTMAGWYWDSGALVFPATGDSMLLADDQPRDLVVRDEIDRTVQSVGWFFDTDPTARMRVREWPHIPEGDPLVVTDCDPAVGLVAHVINFADDQSLLLNHAVSSNTAGAEVTIDDEISISITKGKRGRAQGFPWSGLAWSVESAIATVLRRVTNRFARLTRQVEAFQFDTSVDQRWLEELADIDTGRAVTVVRTGIRPLTLDAVVVGWNFTIEPGQWTGTISTSTLTPSY